MTNDRWHRIRRIFDLADEMSAAERADGQFEHRVALKLVRGGSVKSELRERFLDGRQILARLQHPGIARLLDGGVTGSFTVI